MQVPLLYNPVSGGGRGAKRARRAVDWLAREGIEARLVPTVAPMDASRIAHDLARAGSPRILVIGGDGTISEALDGILRSTERPEVGLLPGGTGNSFLRHFDLADLGRAIARVATGAPREVDAAIARWAGGERWFVDVFGVGFMAKVCELANARYKWMGAASYSWAVLPELARLRAPVTRLVLDGVAREEPLALVAVCNAQHTGGAMRIAPMAAVDDGLLDVVALRDVSRARLLRLFPKIFDGSHVGEPDVLVARAKRIRIEPVQPSPLLGDGEVYGETPVEIECVPRALRLLA